MTLSRNTKIILMFAPLLLGAVVLALVVDDVRHPQTNTDTCMVIAMGPMAAELQTPENTLYAQGNNPVYTVAFKCQARALAVINDLDLPLTNVQAGNGAVLTHKRFKYLPDRWHFDITTPEAPKIEAFEL